MGKRRRRALPAGARRVRDRIEHWRRTREKRSPMPEPLWAEAVALARTHGVYRISQALQVNYDSLKARVARAPKVEPKAKSKARAKPRPAPRETRRAAAPSFVELAAAPVLGVAQATGAVVEVVDRSGTKLTIRLPAEARVDVAAVMRAFRSRRR